MFATCLTLHAHALRFNASIYPSWWSSRLARTMSDIESWSSVLNIRFSSWIHLKCVCSWLELHDQLKEQGGGRVKGAVGRRDTAKARDSERPNNIPILDQGFMFSVRSMIIHGVRPVYGSSPQHISVDGDGHHQNHPATLGHWHLQIWQLQKDFTTSDLFLELASQSVQEIA